MGNTLVVSSLLVKFPYIFLGSNWTIDYPTCGGSHQSPINIDTDTTMSADYSDFMFSIGYKVAQMGTLENNGHTCKGKWLTNLSH